MPALLARGHAIVLERVARGAGETRWYTIASESDLALVADRVAPGSVVSFHFDDRLRFRVLDERFVDDFLSFGAPEAVVGRRTADQVALEVGFPSGLNDLTEFVGGSAHSQEFLLGAFPSRDSDGQAAVTVTLPDRDGVTRPHPH